MKAFLRTTIFLAALTALLIGAGALLGGRGGMIIALLLAGVMNFGAWWFSDRLVLMQFRAEEVNEATAPNLYRIIRELTTRANMPMPKIYIAQESQPNAFATGRSPSNAAVCATTGLLEHLDHDEIMGVMAHELAHIRNHDTLIMTVAATVAGALGTLANMAMWSSLFSSSNSNQENSSPLGGIGAILVMILGPIAASLVQFAISRTREYEADRIGAEICGKPEALASALNKLQHGTSAIPMKDAEANPATAHVFIANPLSGGSIQSMFSTHPPMEERIRRLMEMAHNAKSASAAAIPPGRQDYANANTEQDSTLRRAKSRIPSAGYKKGPWG